MLTQGKILHVSMRSTHQLVETYQLKGFKIACEPPKEEGYSFEEFLLYLAEISKVLSEQAELDRLSAQLKIQNERAKEELRIAFEIIFLELLKAFYAFLEGLEQQRKLEDDKRQEEERAKETALIQEQLEIEETHREQSYLTRAKLFIVGLVLTVGALLSEASDGFLGGMTLVARAGGKWLLILAGMILAGFHAAVHYMTTIIAMKRQIGLEGEGHINAYAKIHAEQNEMLKEINQSFLDHASTVSIFGGHQENYIAGSKAVHLFNQRMIKKNQNLKPYEETTAVKGVRWFVSIMEAIVNGSFSYFSIKLMFLFVLGFASITPAGWGFFAFSVVIILLATLATVANMLGDMEIGVIEAFKPGYREIDAMFEGSPNAIKESLECQRKINFNIGTTLTNELVELEGKIKGHVSNNIVIHESAISQLRESCRSLQARLEQAKKNGIDIDAEKNINNRLRGLGEQIDLLEKKNQFLLLEAEVNILNNRIEQDFKTLVSYQVNLGVIEGRIQEFTNSLAKLEKIVVSNPSMIDPNSRLAFFQKSLKEHEERQKQLIFQKPPEIVRLEKEVEKLQGDLGTKTKAIKNLNNFIFKGGSNGASKEAYKIKRKTPPPASLSNSPHVSPNKKKPKYDDASQEAKPPKKPASARNLFLGRRPSIVQQEPSVPDQPMPQIYRSFSDL